MYNKEDFEKRLGLWFFCIELHTGQNSRLYRIQCKLYNLLMKYYGKRYLDDLTLKTLPYKSLIVYTLFLQNMIQEVFGYPKEIK